MAIRSKTATQDQGTQQPILPYRTYQQALFAAWLFSQAAQDYLDLPAGQQEPLQAEMFKSLSTFVGMLEADLEGNGPYRIQLEPLRRQWQEWLAAMPLPSGPVPRSSSF